MFVSFDVSALSTSILVLVALEIIKQIFKDHINQAGIENFLEHTCFIPKEKVISLLELLLNNCVFSFQGRFYQIPQGPVADSPVSAVIANIYTE